MLENWGPYIAVGIVLIAACFWGFRPKHDFKAPGTQAFDPKIFKHFIKRESLFVNASEQALYAVLISHLSPKYHIFTKVRLEDIIGVRQNGLSPKVVWSLRGRVKSRHVDFLIASSKGKPLMIIELDGSSHQSKSARRPDDLKNGLAEAVGLSMRRVKVGQNFHHFVKKIKAELSSY